MPLEILPTIFKSIFPLQSIVQGPNTKAKKSQELRQRIL